MADWLITVLEVAAMALVVVGAFWLTPAAGVIAVGLMGLLMLVAGDV